MIEKKTMGYVDFEYPNYAATAVTAIVNTETNEVEIYQPDETSRDWYTPKKADHFYPTVGEATEALEKFKKEMIAKMPEVKSYLETMRNWFESTDEEDEIQFKEEEYLPYCYRPDNDDYYKKRNKELDKENNYLLDIIRTGFINAGGDTVKVEDIEQIKWGADKAELCLKGDRKARTCNPTELNIITKIFGHNFSGFTYTRLNEKPNGTE
jgi:hypothetical protein